jgi:hypothetical protein
VCVYFHKKCVRERKRRWGLGFRLCVFAYESLNLNPKPCVYFHMRTREDESGRDWREMCEREMRERETCVREM